MCNFRMLWSDIKASVMLDTRGCILVCSGKED
uniref:Uncharacterized protein n=1 Tax=Rhizophora mucronata TaxID=61149 RepID=A0A2P2Q8F7_RHIMU